MSRSTLIYFLFITLELVSGTANATDQRTSPGGLTATVPHFFEIRKAGKVSWILGTMHIGIDYTEIAHTVEPRLEQARLVFFEIADTERAQKWISNPIDAILTSSESDLNEGSRLSEQTQRQLIGDFHIDSRIASRMHSASCSVFALAAEIGEPMLDRQLMLRAERMGKTLRSLDTDQLREEADSIDKLQAASKFGAITCDLAEYMKLTSRIAIDLESVKDRALYWSGVELPSRKLSVAHRNVRWISTLTPDLDNGGIFIAAGLGHLYGEKGLLRMVRERGFQIKQIQ